MVVQEYNNVIRLTEPTIEPVTLEQIKDQLRIEQSFTLDDSLLNDFNLVARARCEEYANRYFAESDFLVLFDKFPDSSRMKLPFPDTIVNSVTYLDSDNTEQSLTGFTYDPYFQELIYTGVFPVATNVKINVTSGKSYDRANQAILLYVSDFYEVRTAEKSEPNYAAESMLYRLRVEIGA